MPEIKQQKERFVLVGVATGDEELTKSSLDELAELVDTAGGESVAYIIQNRDSIHPGTYVGTGKILEIKETVFENDATGIVCDDELTAAQIRNLEEELDITVLDRTAVILDIFASHATTGEGKLQVELAQLRYRLNRLTGMGKSLTRQGGGIGTRGPGEKKLEIDRRLIKSRISTIKKELGDVVRHREVMRKSRERNNMVTVTIVGYTNAGKSTTLNKLTGANVLEQDQLFATLDPTTRQLELESGSKVLLTDTVGFINKLPHNLVEAFKSTLEEAKYADIILHVVDASNPEYYKQMHVVYDTLDMLGVKDKPVITLFNKCDKLDEEESLKDLMAEKSFFVSAKTGQGLEDVLEYIEKILRERKMLLERVFPYDEVGKIQMIRNKGELLEESYQENGVFVRAYVPKEIYGALL